MFALIVGVAVCQTKQVKWIPASKYPKDSLISLNARYTIMPSEFLKPNTYNWIGYYDKPAMIISAIDSNRRTTVHLDRKQIIWLNDSTFYIQHTK